MRDQAGGFQQQPGQALLVELGAWGAGFQNPVGDQHQPVPRLHLHALGAVGGCLEHPRRQLSLQLKLVGPPAARMHDDATVICLDWTGPTTTVTS